jgi:hypothetical protein
LVAFSICKFAEETGRGNAGLPNVLPNKKNLINNSNKKINEWFYSLSDKNKLTHSINLPL